MYGSPFPSVKEKMNSTQIKFNSELSNELNNCEMRSKKEMKSQLLCCDFFSDNCYFISQNVDFLTHNYDLPWECLIDLLFINHQHDACKSHTQFSSSCGPQLHIISPLSLSLH